MLSKDCPLTTRSAGFSSGFSAAALTLGVGTASSAAMADSALVGGVSVAGAFVGDVTDGFSSEGDSACDWKKENSWK